MGADESRTPAYFAIIPANVRYHQQLSPNAKLLYGEITALADRDGFCWASNKYLAKQFRWGERTVSRLITQMSELGLIRLEMYKTPSGSERRIFVGNEAEGGISKIGERGIAKTGETPRGGVAKIGEGGVAKTGECINMLNNIQEYIPPKAPQGGHASRKRSDPKKTADWKPERFDAFWEFYRSNVRPEAKQAAIRAWDKLQPDDDLIARIGRALQRQIASQSWQDGYGKPYASTYLNNARWEDAEGLPPAGPPPLYPDDGRHGRFL